MENPTIRMREISAISGGRKDQINAWINLNKLPWLSEVGTGWKYYSPVQAAQLRNMVDLINADLKPHAARDFAGHLTNRKCRMLIDHLRQACAYSFRSNPWGITPNCLSDADLKELSATAKSPAQRTAMQAECARRWPYCRDEPGAEIAIAIHQADNRERGPEWLANTKEARDYFA